MKCCRKDELVEAIQFKYVDGVDGKETHKVAKKLGLSQNVPHSVLWEIQLPKYGWKLVDHNYYVIYSSDGKAKLVIHPEMFEKLYVEINQVSNL